MNTTGDRVQRTRKLGQTCVFENLKENLPARAARAAKIFQNLPA
jgi:hypothetical protein